MKKLAVASAVVAALTSFASTATDLELSHGNDKETAFKMHHEIIGGLNGGFEIVGANNLKHHKETTFSLDYKVDMGNAYIMPSFDLTMPSGYSKEYKYQDKFGSARYKDSNVAKIGLKGGFDFGNGLYTAARYRYEMSDGKGDFAFAPENGTLNNKSKLHRVDLTVGYQLMDTVDLSANYIVKRGKLESSIKDQPGSSKTKSKAQEFEFKAVLTSLGQLKPYAQYTYKSKTHLSNSDLAELDLPSSYKNDNVFKIGVEYSF